jgi:hypothetical protein
MTLDKRVLALLTQLDRMAINGWSEGLNPAEQCGKIHARILEFVEAARERKEES